MSEEFIIKQPIKRLEIAIGKFNDVAVPYHLELLKRHKNNVKKFQENQEWSKVHMEQINAMRVVKQLKQFLYEMDMLRSQVQDCDILMFDKLTKKTRMDTIAAVDEYLELELKLPFQESTSTSQEIQSDDNELKEEDAQLQAENDDIERQKACLHIWNSLQSDLQQLHQLFIDFNRIVHEQGESVNRIENEVELSRAQVHEGAESLKKASKLASATYPLAGAFIGTCIAGPIGFLAGLKIGGLSAIGGGLLGYTGGALLKRSHSKCLGSSENESVDSPGDRQLTRDPMSMQMRFEESKKRV